MDGVLGRIDAFCDSVPRANADVIDAGPLRLFVRDLPSYARPVPGGARIGPADVARMRGLQRAHGMPEAFEWLHAAAPTMEGAVRAAGLPVLVCPVLVLAGEPFPAPLPPGHDLRLLGPLDGDLAHAEHALRTAASAAFGQGAAARPTAVELADLRADLGAGRIARALVTGPDGAVAAGAAQRAGKTVELVGIGTVPSARGRGLATAVTAALAGAARAAGADLVFLAAGDATATRVYERVGFRHVGTCGLAGPP